MNSAGYTGAPHFGSTLFCVHVASFVGFDGTPSSPTCGSATWQANPPLTPGTGVHGGFDAGNGLMAQVVTVVPPDVFTLTLMTPRLSVCSSL